MIAILHPSPPPPSPGPTQIGDFNMLLNPKSCPRKHVFWTLSHVTQSATASSTAIWGNKTFTNSPRPRKLGRSGERALLPEAASPISQLWQCRGRQNHQSASTPCKLRLLGGGRRAANILVYPSGGCVGLLQRSGARACLEGPTVAFESFNSYSCFPLSS